MLRNDASLTQTSQRGSYVLYEVWLLSGRVGGWGGGAAARCLRMTRGSRCHNIPLFVSLQVRNLTLAFQAAESIGIKPSLVSSSATDHTHSHTHTQCDPLIRQIGASVL